MRICILTPISIRAFQKYFPDEILPEGYKSDIFVPLVEKYLENGHEVIVCSRNTKSLSSKIYRSKNLTIFLSGCLIKSKLRAFNNFNYEISRTSKFLKNNPCDIYHAHWSYEFAAAALKVDSNRTIVTLHDWPKAIYEILHDYYRYKRLQLSKDVFAKGVHFTTVSPYIAELFNKEYEDKKITIIPNYITASYNEISGQKILNVSAPTVVSINTFNKIKNIQSLLKAFELIRKQIPDVKLRLIGRGMGINEAAYKWAKINNCILGVEFIGEKSHSEAMRILANSDLLIHTSLEESFGLTLIEAMMYKTAVIGGRKSGAVPWVLKDGNAGRLVDVEDIRNIADNAVEILTNSDVWNEYILAGEERVKDFSLEKIQERYMKYYKHVIYKWEDEQC